MSLRDMEVSSRESEWQTHRRLTTEGEQNSRWGPDNGLSCSLWTKTEMQSVGRWRAFVDLHGGRA